MDTGVTPRLTLYWDVMILCFHQWREQCWRGQRTATNIPSSMWGVQYTEHHCQCCQSWLWIWTIQYDSTTTDYVTSIVILPLQNWPSGQSIYSLSDYTTYAEALTQTGSRHSTCGDKDCSIWHCTCKEDNQNIKYYRNNSCAHKMVTCTKVYIEHCCVGDYTYHSQSW